MQEKILIPCVLLFVICICSCATSIVVPVEPEAIEKVAYIADPKPTQCIFKERTDDMTDEEYATCTISTMAEYISRLIKHACNLSARVIELVDISEIYYLTDESRKRLTCQILVVEKNE